MSRAIVVRTLAGDALELELPVDSTIWDLKQTLAGTSWHVPEACQRLVGGEAREPLLDSQPLDEEQYTLLLSLEPVSRDLRTGSLELRLKALQDLCTLGRRGGDAAIAAVLARAEDDASIEVRCAAVDALQQLARVGDRQAVIAAIAARAQCSDSGVRDAALGALARVAEPGDREAIATATSALEAHNSLRVRTAGAKALAKVSLRGDQRCVAALANCLDDCQGQSAEATLEALARVAEEGDERALAAIHHFLRRPNSFCVRAAAQRALARLSSSC